MKAQDFLSTAEINRLTQKSDIKGLLTVLLTWGSIAVVFAIPAIWPNPVTCILAIVLLGGRQLALSVLVHDCGHRTLFKNQRANEFVGRWFAAYPLLLDMDGYAKGHLEHHRKSGTAEDPDLPNYKEYPISRNSFYRKVWRDLSGQTAFKAIKSVKRGSGDALVRGPRKSNTTQRALGINAILFLLLAITGKPWLYLLWVAAYFTMYMLIIRIRQIAEHANVPDLYNSDSRLNTRTVYAGPLARLLLAPNRVNYHLEHHLLASVPLYHLVEMHQLLKQRGAYHETEFPKGYWQVIQQVTL